VIYIERLARRLSCRAALRLAPLRELLGIMEEGLELILAGQSLALPSGVQGEVAGLAGRALPPTKGGRVAAWGVGPERGRV
jgi:hypothetical protein